MSKSSLHLIVPCALLFVLAGCSTPPPPEPEAPPTLLMEFQAQAGEVIDAGGLAAVGIGESKSLNIALNRAKAHGRRELARTLNTQIDILRADVSTETGQDLDGIMGTTFRAAGEAIISEQIQRSIATKLQYETIDDVVIAYALMELNPKVIIEEISTEPATYKYFKETQAYESLDQDAKGYEVYQTTAP